MAVGYWVAHMTRETHKAPEEHHKALRNAELRKLAEQFKGPQEDSDRWFLLWTTAPTRWRPSDCPPHKGNRSPTTLGEVDTKGERRGMMMVIFHQEFPSRETLGHT